MKSVCIIGAGASGLTAIKCCKDEGLAPVCFERTEELGGLWNYHEQQREDGQASVYKSTVINTSKEMMSYSDYPIPSEYPIYMHNKHVAQYFNLYADEFGLRKYIQFQTSIKFAGKDRGSRYNREDFMEKDSLEIDTSSNPAFCRTAKLLIGCAEVQEVPDDNQPGPTPKKRRLNLANVEETAVEDNFPTKYIGVHEVPVALLQRPQPGMLARDIKVEWVKVLRDRLQRTTTLQTVLPVLVNPDEVTKKEDFSVENLERYNYMTLGGNHLREALQGLPVISESMKYIQCHIYVGLTEEEAIKLGNQHNAKNKHLCLTFQDKVRQARSLFLASDEKLRERLTDRLGILEMKEVNKESLSTILSVSRYSEAAYQCAQTLFEAFEGKCGVEKSIPQKIFRTLQGETEETRVCVLQMAEGTSLETAVTWYEKSIMRQQLQDTFQERTGCTSWEQAQASYPAHSQEIENLVGLSKKAAAKQLEEIACQAKEKINQMINVDITIKKGHFVMDNEEVQDIIKKYKKKIVQEVLHVKKRADFAKSGQWDVRIKDNKGEEKDLVFDAVLVCTGHHASVNKPTFPGLDKFKGKVLHSHDYKHMSGFEDKRILIIGIGNSGGDAAVELSRVASQVYLSTRRGTWILHRLADYGMPFDMIMTRRWRNKFMMMLPPWMTDKYARGRVNKTLDHEAYRLKPDYGVLQQHPMVNDDIANRIIVGSVVIKPDIEEFTENGVRFTDETFEDNIDVVFLATGYVFGFPFLDKDITEVKNNQVTLYKYVFPPDLEHNTLGIIGCIQPLGAIMPIAELQCRLAARVFKGEAKLPDRAGMLEDIELKRQAMSARYVKSQRHTIQVDWIPFMDELAELNGCKPDLKSLFMSDPKLAASCYFGPCTPYQYRLQGPGKWTGARQAIMTQWDRTLAPLKTRPIKLEEKKSMFGFFLFYIVFTAICLFILSLFM